MAVARQMNEASGCHKTGMQRAGTARNANARGSAASAQGHPEVFGNPVRVSSGETGLATCVRDSRPSGANTQGVAELPKGSVNSRKGTDPTRGGCHASGSLNKRRAVLAEGSSNSARVVCPGTTKVRRFQASGADTHRAAGISEVSSGCSVDVSAGTLRSSTSKDVKASIRPASVFRNSSVPRTRVASDHNPKILGSRVQHISGSVASVLPVDSASMASADASLSRELKCSGSNRHLVAPSTAATAVSSMSSNSESLVASCAEKHGVPDPPEGSARAPDLLDKSPSPARSTPKLERHFSFELEEGCLVLAEETVSKPKEVLVAKEKPVKPLRKNLPKAISPGLKRHLPEGINSIFSGAPDGAKMLGIVGKKSSKVVRVSDDRRGNTAADGKGVKKPVSACEVSEGKLDGKNKPEASLPVMKQVAKSGNNAFDSKRSNLRDVRKGVRNQGDALEDPLAGSISKKSPKVGIREVEIGSKSGNTAVSSIESNGGSQRRDADGLQQDAEPPRATGAADTADGRPPEGVEVEDVGSPDRESEQVARTHSDAQIPVGNDSPVKLVSQDSGIDTRESIEVPRMFPEYFSCLTQATSTPRRCIALVNDYGDVSEDIGLDKLCGMVTRAEDDLTPQCELSGGTFCNYQLDGEFGDVSEDLGIDRFAQGRAQGPAAFPGNSADSGMFVLDDPYIYDEDYVTCNEDEEFALNDELMMEVLCANRVNQMTRTYDDVEAMRRLLEEKEKDLELTARIGKELLERNQELKAQVQSLQAENRSAHESNTQLKHELHQKTQILHALTSDEDGSVVEVPSPVESAGKALPGPVLGPIGVGEGKMSARESVARLKRKVDQLEQENKSLRQEATQLASETQLAEETEAILVEGVAQQLASVVDEKRLLENEVERMRGEERRMREEMELLLERLAEAHKEIERLREENALLSGKIQITTDTQDRLAMELADFKEQYQEVSCLLSEAQENLRKVRQKSLPSALTGAHYLSLPITRHGYYGNHPGDSIASELEISMISEMSLDSGIHMPEAQGRIPHYRKVFETYRSASRTSNSPSPSPLHRMPSASSLQGPSSFAQLSTASTLSASSMNTCRVSAKPSTTSTPSVPTRGSSYSNEVPKHLYGNLQSSFYTLDSAGQSEESDHSGMATDNEDCLYPGKTRDGVPGSPGAKELQAALTRLDRERQPQLTKGEKAIGGYEGKNRGSSVDVGPHRWSLSSSSASVCQALPYGCRTPDSIMSTGSSRGSRSSWKMPERLMIMKIREGSQFLDEWSRLATPSLSAALEERPGVKVRGRMTDGVQHHNLMDFEEDDDEAKSVSSAPIHPGKFFQSTNSVYTYTNSTVLHPDNTPIVPPSSLPQSPAPSSPSQQPTPLLSRRSSVSAATPTFSTALGLAKMLHERGISASSSDNDQSKGHFTSATVTPCNSPDDGSPFSSRSPSPEDANPIASLISSGAELLRRSLGGAQKGAGSSGRGARAGRRTNRPPIGSLSRSDRKALAGMKLVEKLERIGLESLMQYSQPVRANQGLVPLTTTLQVGSMYARPMAKSPMAQLTSLKSTLRSRSREEPEETDGPSPAKQKPQPCRRQDLGTVPTSVRKNTQDASSLQSHTARGTISAIFFGRKGGLM